MLGRRLHLCRHAALPAQDEALPSPPVGPRRLITALTIRSRGIMGAGHISPQYRHRGRPLPLCLSNISAPATKCASATMANAVLYVLTGFLFPAPAVPPDPDGDWVLYPIADTWCRHAQCHHGACGHHRHRRPDADPASSRIGHQASCRGQYRPADRRAQPPRPFRALRPDSTLPVCRFCCSISITSSRSTTSSATPRAMRPCGNSPKSCAAHLNATDVVARIGGEEFCVVLPGRNRYAARMIGRTHPHRVSRSGLAERSGGRRRNGQRRPGDRRQKREPSIPSSAAPMPPSTRPSRSGRNKLRLAERLQAAWHGPIHRAAPCAARAAFYEDASTDIVAARNRPQAAQPAMRDEPHVEMRPCPAGRPHPPPPC